MKKIAKLYNNKFLNIFLVFQPIVDIITSFMIRNLDTSITLGIIVRTLFLVYALIYLVFISKEHKKIKIFYFSTLIIYSIGFLIVNCNNIYLFSEMTYYIKFIYYPIILLFLIECLTGKDSLKYMRKTVIIINLIMIISYITGTTIASYDSHKIGNSGWFFSANELSLTLSILFPIIFYNFINKTKKFNIAVLILTMISMLAIGTKTTYLAIIIVLISYIIYLFIYKIVHKNEIGSKIKKTIVVLLIIILLTPAMPIYKNMNYHMKYLNLDNLYYYLFNVTKSNSKDGNSNIPSEEEIKNDLSNLVFYGRENYLKAVKKAYNESSIDNKLFGLGKIVKEKNIESKYYEVERDFHDIFFSYGIIGFILFTIIHLFIISIILEHLFKNFKSMINDKVFFLTISIIIGYLISYIAGHTLLSVSCATYMAYIFATLYCIIVKGLKKEEKKVMFISSVGGHLTQMLELKQIFNEYDYLLVTEKTDVTISLKDKYNIKYLKYGSRKYLFKYIFIFIFNIIQSLYLFIKYSPDVIVTTGTHTAVPMCYIGWFTDKKIIYIESFAKRTSPTLTGKLVYPIATTFVVQWESMLDVYPKAQYWGGIY